MIIKRRSLLKAGMTIAPAVAMPGLLRGDSWASRASSQEKFAEDPRFKALMGRAIDAAMSSGASHVDVRVTQTRLRRFAVRPSLYVNDGETIEIGVRALVNGYWGFAASPYVTEDEVTRLGEDAVEQAKVNQMERPRTVELAAPASVASGTWVAPVEIDAFTVHPVEVLDCMQGLSLYIQRFSNTGVMSNTAVFVSQDKYFASSEGAYTAQRLYRHTGSLSFSVADPEKNISAADGIDLSVAAAGFERYRNDHIRSDIEAKIERLREDLKLPLKPVDVNRYNLLIDAGSVASLLSDTIGAATELDRALGFEANAGGTSYLGDPSSMLHKFQIGNSLLEVDANRDQAGGAASTGWDDEGYKPETYKLVTNGILESFQTNRESLGWLKSSGVESYGARVGGNSFANEADNVPMIHTANLVMKPGSNSDNFESMISGMESGIAIRSMKLDVDFQHLSGFATGIFYEIKSGKRVARLANGGILFRTPELWSSMNAVGGAASVEKSGHISIKGEPRQQGYHTVSAVPAVFEKIPVVDVTRRN